ADFVDGSGGVSVADVEHAVSASADADGGIGGVRVAARIEGELPAAEHIAAVGAGESRDLDRAGRIGPAALHDRTGASDADLLRIGAERAVGEQIFAR